MAIFVIVSRRSSLYTGVHQESIHYSDYVTALCFYLKMPIFEKYYQQQKYIADALMNIFIVPQSVLLASLVYA